MNSNRKYRRLLFWTILAVVVAVGLMLYDVITVHIPLVSTVVGVGLFVTGLAVMGKYQKPIYFFLAGFFAAMVGFLIFLFCVVA